MSYREWNRKVISVADDHPVQTPVLAALVLFVGLSVAELLMGRTRSFVYPLVLATVFGIAMYIGQRMRRAPDVRD
jgi:hypothetical protein